MGAPAPRVLGPADGMTGFLGGIGVRFMIDGSSSNGGFSLVEHPMSAHALAAPLHLHTREDEYSYIIEGRVGALLGDDVVFGGPGDLIFKPRNSGIPSGTLAISPRDSSRSSLRRDSKRTSPSS
jgi:hypothetical protein